MDEDSSWDEERVSLVGLRVVAMEGAILAVQPSL